MFFLTQRDRQPELMDQPGLDQAAHRHALAGLARVNAISRTAKVLFREIRRWYPAGTTRPLRVLDVATGGGDVLLGLARCAQHAGLNADMSGCDLSHTAVIYATEAAAAAGLRQVKFFQHDALSADFPDAYDVVMCSLFLHHLDERQTGVVLQRMAASCRTAVVVDDLRRSTWGYGLAWAGCRLLSRSAIVHTDGPLSVRGAYTVPEISQLAHHAGLTGCQVRRHWPARFLLSWAKAT